MPETNQLQLCDRCGAVLSGYGADRLCAACLLESALLEPNTPTGARASAAPLLAFSDYELLEEIARGGMGVVYRARQVSLNRPVAIKLMLGGYLANAAGMQRFRAEAETAAQLHHPNIVAIYEVGDHEGQPFFSMELVAGRNLAQVVRDESLPSRKAAAYLKAIAEAVQYAHSRSVLHRDLKPSNILIDENDQPRITDFGLAKRLSDPQLSTTDPQLTLTGQVLGSPSFIPPEQAAGQKDAIGPASDVYSLGAILYQLLTGRPPFVAETLTQTLRMVVEQEPVPPRLLNASVPRDLETICLKCLDKDPTRRYETAKGLAADIVRHLNNEPIVARPPSQLYRFQKAIQRNKLAFGAATSVVFALSIGLGVSTWAFLREKQARREVAARAQSEHDAKEAEIAQRKRAEEVSDFLTKAFRSPDPTRDGRTITIAEVLDRDARDLEDKFSADPETKAKLMYTIASSYLALGLHDRALPLLEQCVGLNNRALGPEHLETLWCKQTLAMEYWQRGRLNEAIPLAEEILKVRRARLGPDHPDTLNAAMSVGNYYWSSDRKQEGLALMEGTLKTLKATLGADRVETFWPTTGLADIYRQLGRIQDALGLDEPLLEFRRTKFGPDHPETLHSMRAVAQDYIELGRLQEAVEMLQKTIRLSRTRLGPEHRQTLLATWQLAGALRDQGKLAEAEAMFRENLAISRKALGNENAETISLLKGLNETLRRENRAVETE
jgi:tetratricopeptide (TPR) repeat protein